MTCLVIILESIIVVWHNNHFNGTYRLDLEADRLRIINATVHKGMIIKRFTPRAMGRTTAKNNVLTHVELVAAER